MSAVAEDTVPSLSVPQLQATRSRQNWVLDPFQDALFVIVAPLLVVALGIFAFKRYGAVEATSLIIVTHIVMTVAHHLPTFVRIYGDIDLFKRFKWSFVLGPTIPLAFSIGVLTYINVHGYPVEYFLYLYIMLVLWDPWHFLRQHYGFTRIYDRNNAAPKSLASGMDWWLSATWFVYIMLASGAWLPELLHDLYTSANVPIALSVTAAAIERAATFMRIAAVGMTAIYAGYLLWCRRQGYFVSVAKVVLLAMTFGAMYLAYTPNAWIQNWAPGWTFKVGFAVIGIVHMTQYLAIVWRYNRSLAQSAERSRAGVFRSWHAKGGIALGAAYVAVCLFYGEIVTTRHDNRLLMSVLLAVGFTSTLMHYYFDGFIWKVRHRQNRDALALDARDTEPKQKVEPADAMSWWSSAKQATAGKMIARQVLYFGVPMALLTAGAVTAWNAPQTNYLQQMYKAQSLSQQGLHGDAEAAARSAYAAMNSRLPFARKMTELEPTSAREAELAFLIYNQSMYEHMVMPQLSGQHPDAVAIAAHRESVRSAVHLMADALDRGMSLSHSGREKMSAADAHAVLESWRRQIQ